MSQIKMEQVGSAYITAERFLKIFYFDDRRLIKFNRIDGNKFEFFDEIGVRYTMIREKYDDFFLISTEMG